MLVTRATKPSWDSYEDYGPNHRALQTRLESLRLCASTSIGSLATSAQSNVVPRPASVVQDASNPAVKTAVSPIDPTVKSDVPQAASTTLSNVPDPRRNLTLVDFGMPSASASNSTPHPFRPTLAPGGVGENMVPLKTPKLQPKSEVASRKFFDTMNQKASKGGKKKGKVGEFAARLDLPETIPVRGPPTGLDPSPQFMTDANAGFLAMMEGARGFRGELQVHAEFGRIILKTVNPKHITDDKKSDLLLEKRELDDILTPNYKIPGASYCHPFFTRVLTAIPPDIDRIVNIKSKSFSVVESQIFFNL